MEELQEKGVTIIRGVLNSAECSEMKDEMWRYLEHITRGWGTCISYANPDSWRQWSNLFPKHSMLLQNWQIGQSQLCWNVRQNPKVAAEFAKIWNVNAEELLVSFDGASFHFPPERTGRGWYLGHEWLHCDQSFARNNFECVQGWINAYDTRPGDATLTYLEGSHKLHADFAKAYEISEKDDWYKLSGNQVDWYLSRGCIRRQIECAAGDLVLWDSRTIHAGVEPKKDRAQENFRCCVYVCYTPRKFATAANLKKKQKAFEDMRTTSHWPHKPKLFPINPRTYGAAIPNVAILDRPILTDLGKKLAGF